MTQGVRVRINTEKNGGSAAYDDLVERVRQAASRATFLVLDQMEREAKMAAAGQFRGVGRLAGSIVVRKRGEMSGEVGPTVIYGRIQELGGTIFPRDKKVLHWVDAGGSHFAKHVTLPARPYLKPGVEATKPLIGKIFGAELAKAVAE